MRTTVSIPDKLLQRAEKMAKKRKISRNRLITEAVESYLDEYDEDEIVAKINAVCEKVDTSVDPILLKMAMRSLPREEW